LLLRVKYSQWQFFGSLKATYFREALDFVQIYKKDAMMNSYEIDVHEEESAVELFAKKYNGSRTNLS
jgi:hypothetical protein